MKNKLLACLALAFLFTVNSQLSIASAQGTAFTYAGQLQDSGSPASGTYNLAFSLFNTNTGGVAIAGPVTNNAVNVTNGLFTVLIDFGPGVFTGQTDWLEIGVATNGVSNFTTLSPRQQLAPTPYAIYAESGNTLTGTLSASQLTSIGNTNSTATGNFFVGPSGNSTTSGYWNTANGDGALHEITSGYENTADGYQALYNNTGGIANVGVGYQALAGSGSFNTAVGLEAMYMNGNGSANSAFGALALGNNSSGSFNAASGKYAMWANRIGSYNTANGYEALYSLGSLGNGTNNTANGCQALYSGGTGGNNVADGASALYNSVTGGNNIALGYAAGFNITTGSSNIDIGNPGLASDTNIIRIGSDQTQAFIAGVITGNAAGLTNLNAASFSGNLALTQLPAAVVTNSEPVVFLGSLFLGNTLVLPATASISAGGQPFAYSDANANSYFGEAAGSNGKGTGCNNNTATGASALLSNTTGNNNVANGTGALEASTIGYQNTAIGGYALQNLAAGDNNLALGYNAGNNLAAGTNDIYIGNAGHTGESGVVRIGTSGLQTSTYIVGQLYCPSISIQGGADLAEPFAISTADGLIGEGDVVVIDELHPGQLKLTDLPYDARVAGVVSGANGIHPGIQMHQQGLLEGGKNVALSGRVYVQADTSNGAIIPGDLLTTSSTPGRAMRVSDHGRAQGAILGKAMSTLKEGQGMVLVLVTLQ